MNEENGSKPGKSASGEVPPRATRRSFSREYKLRILREAEEAKHSGRIGTLLRREGLYSSMLVTWRRELQANGLAEKRRGPKPRFTAEQKEIQRLERENMRLRKKLETTEALLDLQKKVRDMMESLDARDADA